MHNNKQQDRSFGELLRDLSREMVALLRHEIELAKVEMSRKANRAGKDFGLIVVGGAITFGGFLTILAASVIWVARYMPLWSASLLMGSLVLLIGLLVIETGFRRLKGEEPAPGKPLERLKEDSQWEKSQAT
jgi:uncharacterized membrane protein YqjE